MRTSEKTMRGVCQWCGRPFKYKAKRRESGWVMPRKACAPCNKERRKQYKKEIRLIRQTIKGDKELKLSGRPSATGNITSVIKKSHAEIASILKLKKHEVERLEREILTKIRNDPELKKLWANFKEEGMPLGDILFSSSREDKGNTLLDYQISVIDGWEAHDRIVEEMKKTENTIACASICGRRCRRIVEIIRKSQEDCQQEILECLEQIATFQRQIAQAVNKITSALA
jgi:hypothetical protein